jgi:hypothetical protein
MYALYVCCMLDGAQRTGISVYALYVCLICMPYMYALYVWCMSYLYALYVCCVSYLYALYVCCVSFLYVLYVCCMYVYLYTCTVLCLVCMPYMYVM